MRSPLVERRCSARSITSRTSARPGVHGGRLLERGARVHGEQAGERRLAGARRPVQDHRVRRAPPRSRCAAREPRPSRCSWPTNSPSDAGRMRAASGRSGAGTPVWPAGRVVEVEEPLHERILAAPGAAMGLHILDRVPDRAQLEGRTTELLQRLIRFNTVNPPGNEQAAQEFLKDLLERRRLRVRAARRPSRAAPTWSRACGPAPTARACACSATWTPCSPNPEEWTVDPWSGELRDGCVWGRGALDMKSQVAAEAAAALTLAEEGWRPEAGELLIVFTADEETGAEHGAQLAVRAAPGQGGLRHGGERGRRRGVRVRRPPPLRRLRRREGRVPLHAHHRGPRRATPRSRASATTRWSSSRRSSRRSATGGPPTSSRRSRRRSCAPSASTPTTSRRRCARSRSATRAWRCCSSRCSA